MTHHMLTQVSNDKTQSNDNNFDTDVQTVNIKTHGGHKIFQKSVVERNSTKKPCSAAISSDMFW